MKVKFKRIEIDYIAGVGIEEAIDFALNFRRNNNDCDVHFKFNHVPISITRTHCKKDFLLAYYFYCLGDKFIGSNE